MNFNQLQKLAKNAGWTKGYKVPKHVFELLNNAIDKMTAAEQTALKAECNARAQTIGSDMNFIGGFFDVLNGKLMILDNSRLERFYKDVVALDGRPGVIDVRGLTKAQLNAVLQSCI